MDKNILVIPSDYRLLREGELMLETDWILNSSSEKWEQLGDNADVNRPWTPSYRPAIRYLSRMVRDVKDKS